MAEKSGSPFLVCPGSASHLAITGHQSDKYSLSDYEWWRSQSVARDQDCKSGTSYYPIPTTHMAQYGEGHSGILRRSQGSYNPLPKTQPPQLVTTEGLGIPTQTALQPVFSPTRSNMGGLDVVLSLRGGGGGIGWSQFKKPSTDRSGLHCFSSLSSSRRAIDGTPSSSPNIKPTPPPPVLLPGNLTNTETSKRFSEIVFSSFDNLLPSVQMATDCYLRGEVVTGLTQSMHMPLMDLFFHLRLCVLLLCESENPRFHEITRSSTKYAMFRNGLNSNFLEKDDQFVRKVRAENPKLDLRLNRWSERLRIIFAFQTINFPAIMGGKQDTVADVGGAARKRKVDYAKLGDLEMI